MHWRLLPSSRPIQGTPIMYALNGRFEKKKRKIGVENESESSFDSLLPWAFP